MAKIVSAWRFSFYKNVTVGSIVIFLWILSSGIALIKIFRQIYFEWQMTKQLVFIENEQLNRITKEEFLRNATVQMSPDIEIPQVTGIFKAYIYLPEMDLSDDEMRLVLRHEIQHFHNRDICYKLFYAILGAVFWWNPIISSFQKELPTLLELKCDRDVTKNMNDVQKKFYLQVICKVMRQRNARRNYYTAGSISTLATALFEFNATTFIKQRFEVVLSSGRKKYFWRRIGAYILFIGLFIGSYMINVYPYYAAPEGTEDMSEETEDFLLKMNEDKYDWYHYNKRVTTLTEDKVKKKPYCDFEIYIYEESE